MKLNKALLLAACALPFGLPAMAQQAATKYEHSAFKRSGAKYNPQWTQALIKEVKNQRPRFEKASDVEQFCPGYSGASEDEKNNCWVRLSTGIMAFESTYREKIRGFDAPSAGLMQIMAYNCKKEGMDFGALLNHQNNFKCGLRMMGDLISRDGVISNEVMVQGRHKSRKRRRGLGRGGWSVMMKSHMFPWKGRRVQVGHLEKVVEGTRSYRDKNQGQRACVDESIVILGQKFYVTSL
jgi:Transglycosylase SLT domain